MSEILNSYQKLVISIIDEELLDDSLTNYIYSSDIYFKQKSYNKWGLFELKKYIEKGFSIENFCNIFDTFAAESKISETSFMFSTAVDIGYYILDIYLDETTPPWQ